MPIRDIYIYYRRLRRRSMKMKERKKFYSYGII